MNSACLNIKSVIKSQNAEAGIVWIQRNKAQHSHRLLTYISSFYSNFGSSFASVSIALSVRSITATWMSFWRNFRHWLQGKLSFWQLPVQSVSKTSSIWYFLFSDTSFGVVSAQACTIFPVMILGYLYQFRFRFHFNSPVFERVRSSPSSFWRSPRNISVL